MAVETVEFSNLVSWLENQPENTINTPYELNITGLTSADLAASTVEGSLGWCLRSVQNRYVDLIPTTLPNSRSDMSYCFYKCTSLVNAPIIPNSITRIIDCFYDCTSLVNVPNIPNSVLDISYCFYNCSSLEEITLFEANLKSLVNTDYARGAFSKCPNLTKIGIQTDTSESDWHVFSLKFGADNVSGKVYDKHGTASTIQQTQITKSDLILPVYTDELWFPSGYTDAQIEAIIQKMITYKYGVFNKETIPPDEKTFVLQADNPAHFRSNLPFVKESDVVDTVASGNMKAVTSNAVFNLNSVNITYNYSSEPRDILSLILSKVNRHVSFFEIGGNNLTNDPAYTGSGDYYFFAFRTESYISVVAFNLHNNQMYKNVCVNGTWGAWEVITRCVTSDVIPSVTPVDLSQAIADMLNVLAVDTFSIGGYIIYCNYGSYFEANMTITNRGGVFLVRGSTMGWDGVSARDDHLFTASKYSGENWVIKIY